MNIKNDMKGILAGDADGPAMEFTLVFREDHEEGGFVAECLEIPGCVSEGDTMEQADQNIKAAVRACLSVMFEDCVREVASHRYANTSFVGISSQSKISVKVPDLELAYR